MFPALARARFAFRCPNPIHLRCAFAPIVLKPLHHSLSSQQIIYLLGGLGLAGTAGLGGGGVLLGQLGAAEGAHTSNGLLADVSAVTVLGGLAGNTLVDPIVHTQVSTTSCIVISKLGETIFPCMRMSQRYRVDMQTVCWLGAWGIGRLSYLRVAVLGP